MGESCHLPRQNSFPQDSACEWEVAEKHGQVWPELDIGCPRTGVYHLLSPACLVSMIWNVLGCLSNCQTISFSGIGPYTLPKTRLAYLCNVITNPIPELRLWLLLLLLDSFFLRTVLINLNWTISGKREFSRRKLSQQFLEAQGRNGQWEGFCKPQSSCLPCFTIFAWLYFGSPWGNGQISLPFFSLLTWKG